jgi:hypothetical protein
MKLPGPGCNRANEDVTGRGQTERSLLDEDNQVAT